MDDALDKEIKELKFPTIYEIDDFQIMEKVWIYQNGYIYPGIIKEKIDGKLLVFKFGLGLWIVNIISPKFLEKRKYNISNLIYYYRTNFLKDIWNERE